MTHKVILVIKSLAQDCRHGISGIAQHTQGFDGVAPNPRGRITGHGGHTRDQGSGLVAHVSRGINRAAPDAPVLGPQGLFQQDQPGSPLARQRIAEHMFTGTCVFPPLSPNLCLIRFGKP